MKPNLNARQLYALKADMVRALRNNIYRNAGGPCYVFTNFTLAEIAAVLGCTREKVRQLEARGRKQFSR